MNSIKLFAGLAVPMAMMLGVLHSAAAPNEAPRRFAIVIGIGDPLAGANLPVLLGAVNDAKSIAERLTGVEYLVRLMTAQSSPNLKPTRANILSQVDDLSKLSSQGRDTVLVIYFSGHGVSKNGVSYLMPSDAQASAPELTGLALADIVKMMNDAHSHFDSLLLVIDACHDAPLASSGFLARLASVAKDWAVISACGPGEVACEDAPEPAAGPNAPPEDRLYMGLLTKGLNLSRYGNTDRILTWEDALPPARDVVARLVQAKGVGQGTAGTRRQVPQVLNSGKGLKAPFCHTQRLPQPPAAVQMVSVPKGAFWLYTNYSRTMSMPFKPSGWMTGGTEECDQNRELGFLDQMMDFDIKCTNAPVGGTGTCIDWHVRWSGSTPESNKWDEAWAGIAWIAGPTLPVWWAADGDARGRYFDLRGYKCLTLQARARRPGTRLQVKVGPLCRDCAGSPLGNGDSLAYPILREFELGTNWQQCVLPLSALPLPPNHICLSNRPPGTLCPICGNKPNDLSRICSIAMVLERASQPDPEAPVEVWLDDVAFSPEPPASADVPPPPLVPRGASFPIYTNFSRTIPMPLKPYGWMSGGAGDPCDTRRDRSFLEQMMRLDVKCTSAPLGGEGTCIEWQIAWFGATNGLTWNEGWAGLGFFAGRTSPPWWAEAWDAAGGRYYDLRGFNYLVLWAKAAAAQARIKVTIAPLARDCAGKPLPNGDSFSWPLERSFPIGTDWTRCIVPLTPLNLPDSGNKPNDLSRIASIDIIVDRSEQGIQDRQARFWFDEIQFVREEPIK